MQTILIIWPILACAFLTGVLLAWVLFVALPRLRRAERNAYRASSAAPRNARVLSRSSGSSIVDTDQHAVRRSP
jgi:hypothetical protein